MTKIPNGAITACKYEFVGNKMVKYENCGDKECPQNDK